MTPEQRQRLAEMVAQHPNMRVSTLLAKINAEIRGNQLRQEIGYRRRRAEDARFEPGATEGLI